MRDNLFHTSPLAGGLSAVYGVSWLVEASLNFCLHLHVVFSLLSVFLQIIFHLCMSISVSTCPLFIRTQIIVVWRLTLLQDDLIFINYIIKGTVSRKGHSLRCWELGRHMKFERTQFKSGHGRRRRQRGLPCYMGDNWLMRVLSVGR